MPTYQSSTLSNANIRELLGEDDIISLGDSLETYRVFTADELTAYGMTLTVATPLWNPALASHEITEEETIELDDDTSEIELYNNSASRVDVYMQAKTNTPPLMVYPFSVRTITIGQYARQVVVTPSATIAAGKCYLTELIR